MVQIINQTGCAYMPTEKTENGLVVKSNEFIEGHYKLSAISQKITASVISLVNPQDTENELPEFLFTLKEIANLLEVSERRIRKIVDSATLELKQAVITLRKPKSESYRRVGLFNYCEYDHDLKTVGFKFEPALESQIRDFAGNFTQYQLAQIRELKSSYSIRLYEILRKYHPIKARRKQSFYKIELDELKKMLGVKPNAYNGRFERFRVKVIETAQKELEAKTDLIFNFECIRKGRKVGAIKFTIRHNERFEALPENEALEAEILPDTVDENLVAMIRMQLPDISDQKLQILVTGYSRELLMESLLNLAGATARQEIQTTPMQYFQGILKHKRQEDPAPARKHQTTAEKLNDRDWAEGLDLEV